MDKNYLKLLADAHKSKTFLVVALLPCILCISIVLSSGLNFNIPMVIFMYISTFVSGVGITASYKTWNLIGWISVAIFMIINIIVGYYEYFQWTSTYVAIGVFIFYLIIYVLNRYLKHA